MIRRAAVACRFVAVLSLASLAAPGIAAAQARPASDPLRDCESFAIAESKREGGSLKSIKLDRGDSLHENRYDRKIGSQYASSEYIAWAAIEDSSGAKRRARVVCLHTGAPGNKAVYFLEIPR